MSALNSEKERPLSCQLYFSRLASYSGFFFSPPLSVPAVCACLFVNTKLGMLKKAVSPL